MGEPCLAAACRMRHSGVPLKTVFANAQERREYATGDVIFTAGDAGDEMFGVVTG